MADFKIIETQEQLDAIIGDRLKRQVETLEKKYSDYLSPDDFKSKTESLNAQIATLGNALEEAKKQPEELNKKITELTGQLKKYETDSVKNRIASEFGLPLEIANRLAGETEEDIRKDAESFKKYFAKPAPLAKDSGATGTDAAYRELLSTLKN